MFSQSRRDFMQYTGGAAAGAFIGLPAFEADLAAVDREDQDRASPQLFLRLDGVDGGAATKPHEGEIACLAARWGVDTGDDTDGPRRGPPRKRGHVTVLKAIDKATPQLYDALVEGRAIRDGELSLYRQNPDGSTGRYLTVVLDGVTVAAVETGQRGLEDFERCDLLVERFSFKPERVEDA
jgi:type VI secretion system Hcp family effector